MGLFIFRKWYAACSVGRQNTILMLRWVLTFLIIALVAAVFGFTGIAADSAYIAKIIFYIFLVLLVLSLLFGRSIWRRS